MHLNLHFAPDTYNCDQDVYQPTMRLCFYHVWESIRISRGECRGASNLYLDGSWPQISMARRAHVIGDVSGGHHLETDMCDVATREYEPGRVCDVYFV